MEDTVVLVKPDLFILNPIILEEVNLSIILELIHVNSKGITIDTITTMAIIEKIKKEESVLLLNQLWTIEGLNQG